MILLSLFHLSSCAKKLPIVPAVTPESTEKRFVGKFIWYDLFVHNLEEVIPFYEGLFGWSFVNTEPNINRVQTIYRDGVSIGNAVEMTPGKRNDAGSHWLGYVSTEDIDNSVLVVTQNKGSIPMEPKDLPNRGRVAIMADPQGARAALVTSSHGDPPDSDDIDNYWVGSELWTISVSAALEFYTLLFDYEVDRRAMDDGSVYTVLVKDDEDRAAVVKIPWEGEIQPTWVPYIAVTDAMGVIETAKTLGGTILIGADPAQQKNPNAIIADPQGGVFGIVEIGEEQP